MISPYDAAATRADIRFAAWPRRCAAQLIDWSADPILIGWGIWWLHAESGYAAWLQTALAASWVLYLVFDLQRQGRTGQTLAKQWLGLQVVDAASGRPIGARRIWLRWAAHLLDSGSCYVGWLRPLWDARAQTFADKLAGTLVVQVQPRAGLGGVAHREAADDRPDARGYQ